MFKAEQLFKKRPLKQIIFHYALLVVCLSLILAFVITIPYFRLSHALRLFLVLIMRLVFLTVIGTIFLTLAVKWLKGKQNAITTFNIMTYSQIPAALFSWPLPITERIIVFNPIFGLLAMLIGFTGIIWSVVLIFKGFRILYNFAIGKTIIALSINIAMTWILSFIILMILYMSGVAIE